jgi:leader peptidase (prepilin peptidase)/N-methyltransferase
MPSVEQLYALTFFLFGLATGSFLNVVIFRLPREVSIVWPGSRCPGCGRRLHAYENIPVLSWLLQAGKCRGCGARIHWRYPAIELLTGVLWAFIGWRFAGLDLPMGERIFTFLLYLWFTAWLIAITFIDWDLTIIPDELNFSGVVIALAASAFLPHLHPAAADWWPTSPRLSGLMGGLVGMAAGAALLWLLSFAGTLAFSGLIRKVQETEDEEVDAAMGFGDVKLMAFLGAFLGWREVLITFFLATILGSVFGLVQKLRTGEPAPAEPDEVALLRWGRSVLQRWRTGHSMLPFGPFLCLAAYLMLLGRQPILDFVLGRIGVLAGAGPGG